MIAKVRDIVVKKRLRRIDIESVNRLAESISISGLLQPIVITTDNVLVDGNHRLQAAKLLGWDEIPCIKKDIEFLQSELIEIDANLIRNELSVLDQGIHIRRRIELLDILGKRKLLGENQWVSHRETPTKSAKQISQEMGVSRSDYYRKQQIVSNLTPHTIETLLDTDFSNSTRGLSLISKENTHIQNLVSDILKSFNGSRVLNVEKVVKDTILNVKGLIEKNDLLDALESYNDVSLDDRCKLFNGDCRKVDIESGSIDLIFTDPPYTNEMFYDWLGGIAKRTLKEGGLCVCYTSVQLLPKVIEVMSNYLDYHWCCSIVYTQGTARVGAVFNGWKPLLVFKMNGQSPTYGQIQDTHQIPNTIEKSLHPWQQPQNETDYLINHLSSIGDVVYDPYLGTGTTGISCISLGRRFVGCEIDKETFKIGENRIKEYFSTIQG